MNIEFLLRKFIIIYYIYYIRFVGFVIINKYVYMLFKES